MHIKVPQENELELELAGDVQNCRLPVLHQTVCIFRDRRPNTQESRLCVSHSLRNCKIAQKTKERQRGPKWESEADRTPTALCSLTTSTVLHNFSRLLEGKKEVEDRRRERGKDKRGVQHHKDPGLATHITSSLPDLTQVTALQPSPDLRETSQLACELNDCHRNRMNEWWLSCLS